MKKINLLFAFIFVCSIGFSQQDNLLKNKKGKLILPQKGDFAVGIGINSMFTYVGNMFSSSGNNSFNLNLLNNNLLYGKYFLTDRSAIRLKMSISQLDKHYQNNVQDDNNVNNLVIDKLDAKSFNAQFVVGYEKRKGDGRIQVSYGAELACGVSTTSNKYTYGNSFSASNINPTTTIGFDYPYVSRTSNRTLERKIDNGFSGSIRVFTGIEYFLFSKISVGGEIGIGYNNNFNGKNVNNYEYWDYNTNSKITSNNELKITGSSNIDTDILNGQVFLLFHF